MTSTIRGLTVGLVGHYDQSYSRNRLLKAALEAGGADVLQACNVEPFVRRARYLARAARRLSDVCDCLIVPFPGHADAPIVRLFGKVPVVFDPFISLYETMVEDRLQVPPRSRKAMALWLEDAISLKAANQLLFDTYAHAAWAAKVFGVSPARCHRVFVSADEDVMKPAPFPAREQYFEVVFYGSYSPLHGVDIIIKAASLLAASRKDIRLTLIGDGQEVVRIRNLASQLSLWNVRFLTRVEFGRLGEHLAASHVCLGIFGTSGKARRVIPNKVVDAASVGRPTISGDTPAIREGFAPDTEIILVPPGDPEALCRAIAELADAESECLRLASAIRDRFCASMSMSALRQQLCRVLDAALK